MDEENNYGFFSEEIDLIVIYCDNQSCIKLSENPVFHDRSMHIDIQYHHLRDYVQRRIMLLQYIPTKEQDADILTKALSRGKFKFHRCMIGMVTNPFLAKKECQKMQQERLNLTLALVKLSKLKFHISKTTWRQLTSVAWILSLNQLSKFELEQSGFS